MQTVDAHLESKMTCGRDGQTFPAKKQKANTLGSVGHPERQQLNFAMLARTQAQ